MSLVRSSSWPWRPYCHQPKTLSFRKPNSDHKFIESEPVEAKAMEEEGYASRDDNNSKDDIDGDDSIEEVIRGVRLEGRIVFEPAGETSSVIANESSDDVVEKICTDNDESTPSGSDGVAMCVVDSRDPYADFRASMEEMVNAAGGGRRDNWNSLEELLFCYLRVNDRTNHCFIVRAFIDLLLSSDTQRTTDEGSNADGSNICRGGKNNVNNNDHNSTLSSSSPCSPLSFYTSSSSCCSSTDSLSTTPYRASVETEEEKKKYHSTTSTKSVSNRQAFGELGRDCMSSSSSEINLSS